MKIHLIYFLNACYRSYCENESISLFKKADFVMFNQNGPSGENDFSLVTYTGLHQSYTLV